MNNRPRNFSVSMQLSSSPAQGGFVLVIALIVLAAMTLAAAAMVRTIDTSTMLARNISFKRDALNRTDIALEVAINQFRPGGFYALGANTQTSDASKNFSSVMLATDTDGVPLVLKANTSLDTFTGGSLGSVEPASLASLHLGMTPTYLIERMCTNTGLAVPETCILNGRAQAGGTQPNDKPGQLFPPMFRITARVTGPRRTVSYVQAIFSFTNT